ncbi:hypothetical protein BSFA1_08770 [Burkholderia sp. SFA1]|nr:hypothetical protein BSFA1_08770 [Burkholderia sp. SFA1]
MGVHCGAGVAQGRDGTRRVRARRHRRRDNQLSAMAAGVPSSRPAGGVWRNTQTVRRASEASIHARKNKKAIMSDPPIRKACAEKCAAVMGELCSQKHANRLAKSADALSDKESVGAHKVV